jgi:hypothetical protein
VPPCFRCVCGFVSDTPHDPPTHLRAARASLPPGQRMLVALGYQGVHSRVGRVGCEGLWGGGSQVSKVQRGHVGQDGVGMQATHALQCRQCLVLHLLPVPVACRVWRGRGGGRGEVADVADGSVVQWSRPYGWVLACGVASGFCVVLPGKNQSHVRREGVPGAHGVLGVAGWFCSACEAQRTHMRAERPCIQVQCMECAVYGRRDYPRPRWMKIYIGCMRGGCPSYTQLQCVSHMGPPGWRSGCVMVALLYGNQASAVPFAGKQAVCALHLWMA